MLAQTAAKPESFYLCGVLPLIQQSQNKQCISPRSVALRFVLQTEHSEM